MLTRKIINKSVTQIKTLNEQHCFACNKISSKTTKFKNYVDLFFLKTKYNTTEMVKTDLSNIEIKPALFRLTYKNANVLSCPIALRKYEH